MHCCLNTNKQCPGKQNKTIALGNVSDTVSWAINLDICCFVIVIAIVVILVIAIVM